MVAIKKKNALHVSIESKDKFCKNKHCQLNESKHHESVQPFLFRRLVLVIVKGSPRLPLLVCMGHTLSVSPGLRMIEDRGMDARDTHRFLVYRLIATILSTNVSRSLLSPYSHPPSHHCMFDVDRTFLQKVGIGPHLRRMPRIKMKESIGYNTGTVTERPESHMETCQVE